MWKKWITRRSYFWWKKRFISKRQRLLKLMIFIKVPASKSSIIVNFSTQKTPLQDDRIQPSWFKNIWLQRYEVLINEIWRKKNQNGTSDFRICVKHDSPRHRKMCFFNWDCLSYYRSLWISLICFLLVLQF